MTLKPPFRLRAASFLPAARPMQDDLIESTAPPPKFVPVDEMLAGMRETMAQLAGITYERTDWPDDGMFYGVDPGAPEGDHTVITMATLDRTRQHRANQRAARQASDIPLAERVDGVPFFLCPRCGAKSFNANDIQHRYCGRCHVFVDDEIRRDVAEGGLPLVERVDGVVDEVATIDPEDWKRLIAPETTPAQIRASAQLARDRWWANYEDRLVAKGYVDFIRHTQSKPDYQRLRDELLLVLLAHRADATRHPGKLPIDAFWQWREACIRGQREANWIGMPRGGFHPSPVRWICTTWSELEPRRSRMLGLTAPHLFGAPL